MSTIMSFSPMNLRLYDKEERELRTYVSPVFDCAEYASDPRGLCAHIVADNGGGKSTLLLFLEMLFCRPGSNGPSVGKKKALDYLRRAAFDLHDFTPTAMAALVRRDDPSLMRQARDVIFGYVAGLRDAEGTSLDIRRFVIHLSENPGYSLGRLATEAIYDDKGAARPMREAWERLRAIPGCHPYDGPDWEGYVREMSEAGISPILWRELAKMNADEEAAGTYFQSSNAFRNIVGLVSEAQEPATGEQSKPLWDVAAGISRQVATQAEDRERERMCLEAGEAVAELATTVERYAREREELKQTEDHVTAGNKRLKEMGDELEAQKSHLEEQGEIHRRRTRLNEQMRASQRVHEAQVESAARQRDAAVQREDWERKRRALQTANRNMLLDDAARSYRTYKKYDTEYDSKRVKMEALRGDIEASEELSRATMRAWSDMYRAEQTSHRVCDQARQSHDSAVQALTEAESELERLNDVWHSCARRQGAAQNASETSKKRLEQHAGRMPGMKKAQVTFEGYYATKTVEGLIQSASREERHARDAFARAQGERNRQSEALEIAQGHTVDARIAHAQSTERADGWNKALERTRIFDQAVRDSLRLWEEPVELVAVGRYDDARTSVDALQRACGNELREAQDTAARLQRRIEALAAGRLDMSEALRRWLDRHELEARTLASYTGISADVRNGMFEAQPWLAHVLVVDARTAESLMGMVGDSELHELGHPVFFVRQADVQQLLDSLDDTSLVRGGTPSVVHALNTVDLDYADDPDAYVSRLQGKLEESQRQVKVSEQMEGLLSTGRDAITRLASYVVTTGLGENATLADVSARAGSAASELEAAANHMAECEDEERRLCESLKLAEDRLGVVHAELDAATRALEAMRELQERNDECIRCARDLAQAQAELEKAQSDRGRASLALDDARGVERQAQAALDRAMREQGKVGALRTSLEELSAGEPVPEESATLASACSSDELEASVGALRDIVTRDAEKLDHAQKELETARRHRDEENAWMQVMRDSSADEMPIVLEDIEAWAPSDDVARRRMAREKNNARDAEEQAHNSYLAAQNGVTLAEERRRQRSDDLARLGLIEPLDVPKGYDYDAERTAIQHEEERGVALLHQVGADQRRVSDLTRRLDRLSIKVARNDGYRVRESQPLPALSTLDDCDAFAEELELRANHCVDCMSKTKRILDQRVSGVVDAVGRTGEMTAARGVRESIASLDGESVSWRSIAQVHQGLAEHAVQFKTMAATLKNKLRATDESVDDLVHRAVEEGYGLLDELHRLVVLSRVRIKDKGRQRTIDFRSRNQSLFLTEVRRDEVATNRLEREIRTLLMEELPGLEDARRAERARARLEPHELVYLLQDDRNIEVRYPVIRGGRGLSYESARDASGSGSTGQKSAGYVLAFLSLLRYLGSVGSLSSEQTLFVALENQFGKISSSKIIADIKKVVDQTHMQLITVAGRELRSAYTMGDVVFTLYRSANAGSAHGTSRAVRVRVNESDQLGADAVIDKFRATRRFENLRLDF